MDSFGSQILIRPLLVIAGFGVMAFVLSCGRIYVAKWVAALVADVRDVYQFFFRGACRKQHGERRADANNLFPFNNWYAQEPR